MNTVLRLILAIFFLCITTRNVYAAEDSKALAAALAAAIAAKDINAASAMVEWGQAPIAAYRMFKMSVADCFTPPHCKIEVEAMPAEELKPQADYYYPQTPEGQLKIIPPDGNGELSLPFAKIKDKYRIVLGQQTEEAYKKAKSEADARKIAEEIGADLLASGKALPTDGGEPYGAYREYLAALKRSDSDYLAKNGTAGDRYFFGNAYKDNPVKAAIALDLARLEHISDPTIKGGFVKDNRAILLVSGFSGQGWTTEGAVTLENVSGKWVMEDKLYLSYPPKLG